MVVKDRVDLVHMRHRQTNGLTGILTGRQTQTDRRTAQADRQIKVT